MTTVPAAPFPALHHEVRPLNLNAHLFGVTLTIPQPSEGLVLSLPVWIPGSYLVREFAQHLQHLSASLGGQPVALRQLDKHRWQVGPLPVGDPTTDGTHTQATATPPLVVCHEVYARDASVRTAWLDAERGFFNGTSLCLAVEGREHHPHRLTVHPPPALPSPAHGLPTPPTPLAGGASGGNPTPATWHLATGLQPEQVDDHGFGTYQANSYAALVDEPVEMGPFWSAHFEVRGIPHRLVVSGAGAALDGERLVADTQRICEAQMDFWHGPGGQPPFDRYVFMLNASHSGHGGLEHPHSTALICPRSHLPQRAPSRKAGTDNPPGQGAASPPSGTPPTERGSKDGYTRLLGLISHEYFHTWNVKRMRPAEFTHLDLGRENHTELLWLFEGFTSYFDDLLLLRAGLISPDTHLALLTQTLQQVANTPGQRVQTVAQASFDAWTRYYRVQENTPNATVSYYTKGALVALCLDLTLRQHGSSLDHAMRALWARSQGGPTTERDVRAVVAQLAGRSLDTELDAWVHSTADLPTLALLAQAGVVVTHEPGSLAQRLGLRVQEGGALTVQTVLRGGLAEHAGMAAGDEWLAVGVAPGEHWRIHGLDDIAPVLGQATQLTAWVARDRRLLALPLSWPTDEGSPGSAAGLHGDTSDPNGPADSNATGGTAGWATRSLKLAFLPAAAVTATPPPTATWPHAVP